jgi:Mrp family chromosome partitioning ATPase
MEKSKARAEEEKKEPAEKPGAGAMPPGMAIDAFEGPDGENASLIDHVASGNAILPRVHRAQRAFFRFLRKAGSDPKILEEVHRLRDSVILSTVREKTQSGGITVALTGPNGGEGTSILSLLLGLSLGECGSRRVAFLDGRFSIQRFQLLTDVLGLSKNSVTLEKGSNEVVGFYNEAYPNVYFLRNAGSERSMQFFSDKKLAAFLAELRQHFDFTIIDLPPILKETASVFVVPHVDRLYLVAEAGKTHLSDVGKCIQTVRQAAGQLNGVILNKQRTPLWSSLFWRDFFY